MYKLLFASFVALAASLPQQRGNGRQTGQRTGGGQRAGGRQTAQQKAAQVPQGLSQAQDGSVIMDNTVNINGLPIRYRISAPASQFLTTSGVPGAAATSANGTMGVNVLLHGDGGQSFFDFPNQNVQANTMGVALLAPNANLFWGGGQGLQRTDGVAHAQAVNDFVKQAMPQIVSFNQQAVSFTGVSGGSLLMSGFFIPAQMQNYPNSAVELNCGALKPQVTFVDPATVMSQTRIHYQSTQNELTELQGSIPQAIVAYEQAATAAGMSAAQINALQTVDNTPVGGHCAFDGKGFVSGVQTMLTSYSNVVQGGDGIVTGIGAPSTGKVTTGVVGNEKLQFGQGSRKRDAEDMEDMVVEMWARNLVEEVDDVALISCDRISC